ncbi:MAG: group II intron reverse transcriptase/maturase [Chlamydiia bacterium]|nr:group II intron reverse transcriptase/maturase [Chlamydiia bacterium]
MESQYKQKVSSKSAVLSEVEAKLRNYTENLLEEIVSKRNLYEAYKQVKKNKGSHGVDGMEISKLLPYLQQNAPKLIKDLLEETYEPAPVRRVEIAKPSGGVRLLGIPTVIDRMIQQAIKIVLERYFEPTFSNSSYGFRPKRSAHDGLKRAKVYIEEGRDIVVDMDIEKFFDNINHDILMVKVSKRIKDKRVLRLIRKYLNSGIMLKGILVKNENGAPQGGPLSPLLSNIMLDSLDKELENRGHRFVRYADDCNVYMHTKRAGERVLESITKFLSKELKLKVNTDKSAVDEVTKRKFLGYSFYYSEDVIQFRVHPKSIERLKEKIREITNRNISMNFDNRIKKLKNLMVGWINYYKLANMKWKLKRLDGWIRRRLRACIWKTWKRVRTRYKRLIKSGIPKDKAWEYANTRKGCWRISNSPILNRSVTNDRLKRRGYVSFLSQYNKVQLSK